MNQFLRYSIITSCLLYFHLAPAFELEVYLGNRIYIEKYKQDNCYAALWSDYINGHSIDSQSCEVCDTNFSTSFNCLIFEVEQSIERRTYVRGIQLVEDFFKKHEQQVIEEGVFKELKDKSELLNKLRKSPKNGLAKLKKSLSSMNFEALLIVNDTELSFLLDTGASFSTLKEKLLYQNNKTFDLTDYSGASHRKEFGYFKVDDNIGFHAFYDTNLNSLGLNYLGRFESIDFDYSKISSGKTLQTLFFKDSANLFFDGNIKFNDKIFKNRNLCIDTGAKQTVLMKKFYRAIREDIIDYKVKVFKGVGIVSEFELLGKQVDYSEVYVGDVKLAILENTPILFRNNVSVICDVVLGQDALQGKLKEINFKNRTVEFWI